MRTIRSGGSLLFGLALLAVGSCDRLKEAAAKVRKQAEESASEAVARAGAEADEELGGLVDSNDEGYLFRRDLPFPEQVRCRMSSVQTLENGRSFSRDALGQRSWPFEARIEQVLVVERDGGVVNVEIEVYRVSAPSDDEASGEEKSGDGASPGPGGGEGVNAAPEAAQSLTGLSAAFVHREDGWHWRGGEKDFRRMAWAKAIEPSVGGSLPVWGVVPRNPWFSGARLRIGSEVKLSGAQVGLVIGEEVERGEATLRLAGIEPLDGHPCGVFDWTGEVTFVAPTLEGTREHVDISVSEGRVWCSLIHPLVLRSESSGMVTVVTRGKDGALRRRVQGGQRSTTTWDWQAL